MLRTVKFIVLECYRYIAEDGKSFVGERCAELGAHRRGRQAPRARRESERAVGGRQAARARRESERAGRKHFFVVS